MRGENRKHCRFDFRAIERAGVDLLHYAFGANRGRGTRYEQQIASSPCNQCLEPAVELDGAGGLRSILFVRVVPLVNDTVVFRRFVHASPRQATLFAFYPDARRCRSSSPESAVLLAAPLGNGVHHRQSATERASDIRSQKNEEAEV